MPIDRITLKELIDKGSDVDLLREMIAFVTGRMMEMEVESLTGAAHGERSADRVNQPQWLSHARLGDARRDDTDCDPEAQEGQLFPVLSRSAPRLGESARRRHSGGLCAGRVDAFGRRASQDHGDERDL